VGWKCTLWGTKGKGDDDGSAKERANRRGTVMDPYILLTAGAKGVPAERDKGGGRSR